MKACRHIQEMMSAYLECAVSEEEERLVRAHLVSCPDCSAVLGDLKKTGQLVRGLQQVEPPPWLAQKIMAHVKDEPEKQAGILKRIFYPLRIKIPIQAFATLLIVGVVFYVYKSNESRFEVVKMDARTEQASPLKAVPTPQKPELTERRKGETPDQAVSHAPAPAARQPYQGGVGAAAPPPVADAAPVIREEQERGASTRAAEKAEAERAVVSMEREARKADTPVQLQGSRTPVLLQTPKRAAVHKLEPVDVTLKVDNVKAAAKEVEKVLREHGAMHVVRESREGSESVTAELEREKAAPVVERLDAIGDTEPMAPKFPAGDIAIRIKVVPDTTE